MIAKLVTCLLPAIIISAGCLYKPLKSEVKQVVSDKADNTLKIWALSDIQPKNDKQKREFEDAIKDINKNVPDIDLAIVAGDIVDTSDERDFDWYLSLKPSSYVKEWLEIAGNHDLKLDRGEGYKRKIREDSHYSVGKGNLLFIFMSNEARGKSTYISDATFNWWRDLVINNQDKIITVITHAPLEGSGIPFSGHPDRQIRYSYRFSKVLREYKVDLWFSGHLHIPHSFTKNMVRKNEYNGTIFINLSSIRSELLGLKQSESRIVTFVCGSDEVFIRSRNHSRKKFDDELDTVIRLSKKFECGGKKEVTSGGLLTDVLSGVEGMEMGKR